MVNKNSLISVLLFTMIFSLNTRLHAETWGDYLKSIFISKKTSTVIPAVPVHGYDDFSTISPTFKSSQPGTFTRDCLFGMSPQSVSQWIEENWSREQKKILLNDLLKEINYDLITNNNVIKIRPLAYDVIIINNSGEKKEYNYVNILSSNVLDNKNCQTKQSIEDGKSNLFCQIVIKKTAAYFQEKLRYLEQFSWVISGQPACVFTGFLVDGEEPESDDSTDFDDFVHRVEKRLKNKDDIFSLQIILLPDKKIEFKVNNESV